MRVLVLGAGKMIAAILCGLQHWEDLSQWQVYSPSGISAQKLALKVGAQAVSDLSQVDDPEWILVGCKPQQLRELAETLGERFGDSLIVSVLAAIPEKNQRDILGGRSLIRVMPNLPVEFNEGITLITSSSARDRLPRIVPLFSKLGLTLEVTEEELEELTLLTGSGPAFYYEFSVALAGSFSSRSPFEREKLVRQVLRGASRSAEASPKALPEMIDQVTSKGGVTIAALSALRESNFSELIRRGIDRGKQRARELKVLLQS